MSRRKLKAITTDFARFTNFPATSAFCAGGSFNQEQGVTAMFFNPFKKKPNPHQPKLEEALMLVDRITHLASPCMYDATYQPTEADIILLEKLQTACNHAHAFIGVVSHSAQRRVGSYALP